MEMVSCQGIERKENDRVSTVWYWGKKKEKKKVEMISYVQGKRKKNKGYS